MDKKNILVIGGSGFIGKNIIEKALDKGWNITSLGVQENHQNELAQVRYLTCDLIDKINLKKILDGVEYDYVVNCGGYVDHTPYFSGGYNALNAHFVGVLNLVDVLSRDKLKSFVNIGSSDEYGNSPAPQIETLKETPISPYSFGKTASAYFLQMLHRTENYPSTVLRLFLTYGPGQDKNRFIPQIVDGCLKDERFPVSEGEQIRDFCFIDDTVEAIFSAFRSPKARGQIINIGSGQPETIRKIVETVRTLIGRGTPSFGEIPYRSGENMALFPNISKAKRILGWKPKTTLKIGLQKTISQARVHIR